MLFCRKSVFYTTLGFKLLSNISRGIQESYSEFWEEKINPVLKLKNPLSLILSPILKVKLILNVGLYTLVSCLYPTIVHSVDSLRHNICYCKWLTIQPFERSRIIFKVYKKYGLQQHWNNVVIFHSALFVYALHLYFETYCLNTNIVQT